MKSCIVLSNDIFKSEKFKFLKFDFLELRFDLYSFTQEDIVQLRNQSNNLIVTDRNDTSKLSSYKLGIKYGANMIDIELNSEWIEESIYLAELNETEIIVSHHNFEKTESDLELSKIIHQIQLYNPDWIKIATKTNETQDAIRLINLYKLHKNLIAFGIGQKGKFTRISSQLLGAPYTYVYFGEQTNQVAEGQLSLEEFNLLANK